MDKKYKILFVCLGNICRSPAAESIFRDLVDRRGVSGQFEIDSAGTYGGHAGELPDSRMRAAAAKRGYRLTHRSRKLCVGDFDTFNRIVVMDHSNYDDVYQLAPTAAATDKIVRMAGCCKKFPVDHVPDPYYRGQEGFEYVLDILEDACENLLAALLAQ